jgi:NAD(P) transhydrogenase subunit alpha
VAHGVQILAPLNIASLIPVHASQMYSKNIVTLVGEFVDKEGTLKLDFANDVVGPATVTHGGEVVNDRVKQAMGA